MYLSTDSLAPTKEGASAVAGVSMDSLYSVKFLNTLHFNDIANHKLEFKVGVPILLLQNLNQSYWVNMSLKQKSSQGTMSANVCSYLASSCPPPGLIAICFGSSSISCLSGICDDNQQESRSDIEQRWGIFVVSGLFPWLAIYCYLTSHKQCKHQDFQRSGS